VDTQHTPRGKNGENVPRQPQAKQRLGQSLLSDPQKTNPATLDRGHQNCERLPFAVEVTKTVVLEQL
jgi:hypothetical protein